LHEHAVRAASAPERWSAGRDPVRAVALFLALLLLAPGTALASQRLTILHTNDVHGHLRPCSYPSIASPGSGTLIAGDMLGGSAYADLPARRDVGGIARRATLVRRIRAGRDSLRDPVWLVDAGDFFFYSAFSNEYHGEADVLAMNRAGYDFATFGNHEFEISPAQLARCVAAARFPFLCANVTDTTTGLPLGVPCVVRRAGTVRVGLFGLLAGSSARPLAARGLRVEDPVAAARRAVERLRGPERADVVALLSHCGEAADRELARRVPGIDVIVGAHSHTRLPQGEMEWAPERALSAGEEDGTIIVQAGEWGIELGRLDLLLDRDRAGRWHVVRHREQLVPVTRAIPDDPAVAALLDSLWAPFAAKYDEVLATASADFAARGDDLAQNAFYADAVRAAFGTDIAFEGTGGVHWPIVAGPVTRAQLVDLDHASGNVVTFRMKGREIRRFLEQSRPVPSGLRYRTFLGRLEAATVGAAPLDDEREYSCAAGPSVARRLGGFEAGDRRDTGRPWAEVVMDAMRRARVLAPAYDGRRLVVDTLRTAPRDE